MKTEAEKRGNAKWKKENAKIFAFRLYRNTDADLLAWFEKQENKQGLIKRLLREEMEKGK